MDYAATLEYLFSQLPMFSRTGAAAYKADLDNILILCERLQNPHTGLRFVHVAGTNGKGSVSHMLAAALQEAGYKTGLYTSPHLYDFRERIRIDGVPVSEAFVVNFTERVKPLIAEIQPSFFEITVAMAFVWFAQESVDVAVIEVGLGGRLDSTNIITPVLSVITNIGWDHSNLLGNSLEAITFEKAGIIKAGVPVVIGQRQPHSEALFRDIAAQRGSPIVFAEDQFSVSTLEVGAQFRVLESIRSADGAHETLRLDLPGIYQEYNLATALCAISVLNSVGLTIGAAHYRAAFAGIRSRTGLMGRWDVLAEAPLLVLDVAHNADGMMELRRQLAAMKYGRLHLVFGMVRDKDLAAVMQLLPPADAFYFTEARIPRALPVSELKKEAAKSGIVGDAFADVNEALRAALAVADASDLVLVCGSIFLVSEVDRARFTVQLAT